MVRVLVHKHEHGYSYMHKQPITHAAAWQRLYVWACVHMIWCSFVVCVDNGHTDTQKTEKKPKEERKSANRTHLETLRPISS